MNSDLGLVPYQPEPLAERSRLGDYHPSNIPWHVVAFLTVWEVQSHLASIALIALVALASIWIALAAMLVWSLVATVAFCYARERGYPNLLTDEGAPKRRRTSAHFATYAIGSLFRAWLAGFNAFIFARCASFLLTTREECGRLRSGLKYAVLGMGLTLFGVTAAEHMLRKAGYSGAQLTRLGLIGPFLNVPYRILLSAAFIHFLRDAWGAVGGGLT